MPIRELPPVPTRDDPANFALKGDAFLAALPGFREDCNALEQSLQLIATTGTSTTSLTVGTGSKSLTTDPGKAWATGAWVYVFASAAVSNYMVGRVTSYNATTGALVVNVSAIDGSGTHSAWVIGLATPQIDTHLVPRDGSRAMTGALTLPGNAVNALEAVPKQQAETIAASAATSAVANRMQYSLLAAASTGSGPSVDVTSIPAWATRITVLINGVSTSGAFNPLFQLGSGSYATSGYSGSQTLLTTGAATSSLSGGFSVGGSGAASSRCGSFVFAHQGSNAWVCSGSIGFADSPGVSICGGVITLAGTLDRLRLFAGGTDQFDGGGIRVLIEG